MYLRSLVVQRYTYVFFSGEHRNSNKHESASTMSPESLDILEDSLSLEIDFYNYLRARLHNQYVAVTGKEE